MRHKRTFSALASVVIMASNPEPTSAAGQLEIEVNGLRSNRGILALALFPEQASGDFPGKPEGAKFHFQEAVSAPRATINFQQLPPGKYALSALHDENSDGAMNFNFLGIPKEGFGFSRNPRVLFGPPAFEKASFEVGAGTTKLTLEMKYF